MRSDARKRLHPAPLTHHDPTVRALIEQAKADAWDERDSATAQYLGPDNGHYVDCMGWEDCYCATYPNPYRSES